ncbi:MAG: TetR/AcrR family transcriptional regulator [Mycobacterium sp.]|uniref:TetR/AcrR family transcriptional regulator n=1 Tax=Mycobacterium sp. TaxID=1785 RepID=UPI003C75E383
MPATPVRKGDTDRRQLLIDAARELFAMRAYDQVTTSEIAKNAGVAYGLIAHHFDTKRGLYLAVMREISAELTARQLIPAPEGSSLAEQLRHALRNHISYIDQYSDSFMAFVRGELGVDPERRDALEELRWLGAQRVLLAIGIIDPVPPVLRTAMHGWVGYLDEMMIDRIANHDTTVDAIVELAAAALVTTLRVSTSLDPSIAVTPETLGALDTFSARG